eukprot:TRINITY_DN327_c0_g1_i1.p1 TRINITY_DN327_c0_g1~~TRINITY_DN327_c0_g1_i1.p1  ORF type:complete len:399 (-),score=53.46 TRINITY_DN327_c0_g1_i1:1025-2221(-)
MSNGEYFNNAGFSSPAKNHHNYNSTVSSTNNPFRLHPYGLDVAASGGNYKPSQGLNNKDDDEDVQICYDFTKNQCNRGDKCKYSHDIATIIKYNSKEKGICFDFLRGQCLRGMLCKFSHDLSNIAHLYQQANYGATGNNNSSSICYNFLKGVCRDGNTCRYSHDLRVVTTVSRSQSTPVPTQLSGPAPAPSAGLNASDAALALLQLLQGSGSSPPISPISSRHQPSNSLDQLLAQQQLLGRLDGLSTPLSMQDIPRLPVGNGSASMLDLYAKDYLNSPTDVVSSGWGISSEGQTGINELETLVASLTSLQAMQNGRQTMEGGQTTPVSQSACNNTSGEIDDMLAQIQALQMSSANSMQLDRTSSGYMQPQGVQARGSRSMSMGNPTTSHNDSIWRTNP